RGRYPATIAAATYTIVMLVMSWVLALVPAVPKLAPIYNPLTHLVPPGFPLLVIVPAVALDFLHQRLKGRSDWLLAALAGIAFVVLLLAVQWPFSSFLLSLDQPNYFFATGYQGYSARVGPWTKVFFDVPGFRWEQGKMLGTLDVMGMAQSVAFATVLAIGSSRLALWWGDWMRRVQR
ncbi:MAG: hypothetical protein ABIT38_10880, partial [Gemmatimonadaceae bacterium]